jgi:glycine cleavage system transcriptional repressor
MEKLLAVTAIGPDRAGLIRDLSQAIKAAGGNIRESRMATLGSEFAVLVLVSGNWHAVNKIREKLEELRSRTDLTLTIRETQPRSADTAAPYIIDIVSLDHEGIVLGLSAFFSSRSLEIAELNTRSYNAPHTGAVMFAVQMVVNIPSNIQVAALREEFLQYCDEENLDAIMEPAQR